MYDWNFQEEKNSWLPRYSLKVICRGTYRVWGLALMTFFFRSARLQISRNSLLSFSVYSGHFNTWEEHTTFSLCTQFMLETEFMLSLTYIPTYLTSDRTTFSPLTAVSYHINSAAIGMHRVWLKFHKGLSECNIFFCFSFQWHRIMNNLQSKEVISMQLFYFCFHQNPANTIIN